MSAQTESLIIQQLNQGNQVVFEQLYSEYYPRLVSFANGYLYDLDESKELVQNFFINLWLKISEFKIESSIHSYLFTAIKNRCLNHIKNLNITDRKKLQYIEANLQSQLVVTQNRQLQELELQLMVEIEKLPTQIKNVLVLKYFKGNKRHEIAQLLGISENTVKTQLQRGKKKLKNVLDKKILNLFLALI
ncbi:RNA polymerase sigma-70 factor [Marivirga sp. S37H4]|uniref:RNA polymerase sigma-70 factor n=1 Tax=Marivirga aurantiaca TaxID=2802615 RepID=A0A934WVV9_9BACT|nr:RNA polymerase sigma-70 factor [Marivirga aurantiaca]MBK6264018.1 RNA polymerase sigma-70 factor [Marivirga aurantiaca]